MRQLDLWLQDPAVVQRQANMIACPYRIASMTEVSTSDDHAAHSALTDPGPYAAFDQKDATGYSSVVSHFAWSCRLSSAAGQYLV
ncbi:hypothetical protein Q2941_11115 [Bradyrhizobium sp. UFLA05-153]